LRSLVWLRGDVQAAVGAVCGIFWWVSLAVARVTGLRPVLTYVVPVGAGMKLRV
jgi:hypothetical protein